MENMSDFGLTNYYWKNDKGLIQRIFLILAHTFLSTKGKQEGLVLRTLVM